MIYLPFLGVDGGDVFSALLLPLVLGALSLLLRVGAACNTQVVDSSILS